MIDLRTQTKSVDFSGAVSTRPLKTGAVLPVACTSGELFFKSDAPPGANVYTCSSANSWSGISSGQNYSKSFSNQTNVFLSHNLNTTAVTTQCYDNSVHPLLLEPNQVIVTDGNNVTVTFVAAQSGTCVVNGSGGSAGSGGGGAGTVTAAGGPLGMDLPLFGNNGTDIKTGTRTGTGNQAVMSLSPVIASPFIADLSNMQHDHRTTVGGGLLGIDSLAASARSGNGAKLATVGGLTSSGHCAQFDSAGNVADAGFACGSGQGGGTVSAGTGLVVASGVMQVNPASVRAYLTGSDSLNFGTIASSGGCASRTIPVAGAVIGDKLALGAPVELLTYSLAVTYAVSAADTVAIRLCNYTTSSITPPQLTWNVDVVKSF